MLMTSRTIFGRLRGNMVVNLETKIEAMQKLIAFYTKHGDYVKLAVAQAQLVELEKQKPVEEVQPQVAVTKPKRKKG